MSAPVSDSFADGALERRLRRTEDALDAARDRLAALTETGSDDDWRSAREWLQAFDRNRAHFIRETR